MTRLASYCMPPILLGKSAKKEKPGLLPASAQLLNPVGEEILNRPLGNPAIRGPHNWGNPRVAPFHLRMGSGYSPSKPVLHRFVKDRNAFFTTSFGRI